MYAFANVLYFVANDVVKRCAVGESAILSFRDGHMHAHNHVKTRMKCKAHVLSVLLIAVVVIVPFTRSIAQWVHPRNKSEQKKDECLVGLCHGGK